MSGFLRQPQPEGFNRSEVRAVVTRLVAEIAFAERTADPFGIDNACPNNPGGHTFIGSCGDVVCPHCSMVVWS